MVYKPNTPRNFANCSSVNWSDCEEPRRKNCHWSKQCMFQNIFQKHGLHMFFGGKINVFKTSDRPQGKKQFALVRNMITQGTLVIRLLTLLYFDENVCVWVWTWKYWYCSNWWVTQDVTRHFWEGRRGRDRVRQSFFAASNVTLSPQAAWMIKGTENRNSHITHHFVK